MVFTHNNKNDTQLEVIDGNVRFVFVGDNGEVETEVFEMEQDELFWKLGRFFDLDEAFDQVDDLTLPAQDALWNALLWLNQNNCELV